MKPGQLAGGRADRLLDNPVWTSLDGPHHHFADRYGQAVRYDPDVAPFASVHGTDSTVWYDLATLLGPGSVTLVTGDMPPVPEDWSVEMELKAVQMVDAGVRTVEDPDAVRLTSSDVPEMLDLVARTKPGPFLTRTVELGTYLGLRRDGVLVAMAGERMRPAGWSEISAVCTAPEVQGQGLATRLVRAVAALIRARGERAFLHATVDNVNAIRLYESMGFELRRYTTFRKIRVPGTAEPSVPPR